MTILSVNDIAALVRQARRERGWTQVQLAEQAGVSRDWIIALEKAKPSLELALVLRTLKALGLAIKLGEPTPSPEADDFIDLEEVLNPGQPED